MIKNMPVFAIQAKDNVSVGAIRRYIDICVDYGLHEQAKQSQLALEEILQWRKENPDLCKSPDHTHIPSDDPNSFESILLGASVDETEARVRGARSGMLPEQI